MKRVPRFLGVALILALLNVGYINVTLASRASSRQVLAASAVSTSALKSYREPIPVPSPPPHATKAEIKQDLDDTKGDLQTIIGTDPNGFAAQLLSGAGLDPIEDIDQAKTDIDDMSDTDFDNAHSHFDKLHKKFQKRHHNTAAILGNPTLMAMLHRPSPLKFRVVTGNSESTSPPSEKADATETKTNRPFSPSKSRSASGRFSKDLANLKLVITPEITNSCNPANGIPGGINDLILVKAVTLATETVKEAIPDDTAQLVPHSIAVVAWAAAKTAEFVLDALHQTYMECNAVKAGEKTDTALTDIKSSVSSISSNVSSINSNVNSVKTTVGGINTTVNTVNSKVDTVNTTVNNVNTTVNNIDNSVNNITNKLTTINTTVNTTSNNVNTANTNITALSDLSLRLMIEADLAAPDNATPLALFETPSVKGGYLELVRTYVAATIANLAGSSTAQANSFLAQGDAYKAAGNYKAAYAAYRKAYKSASS